MSAIYILSIETATPLCSVSLAKNGETNHSLLGPEPNMHASTLNCFIEQMLSEAQVSKQQEHPVAVSKGPGSYTGLRIGVSVAKGLCYALDIPLIAINTLDAMFMGFRQQYSQTEGKQLFLPMIDARRQEVYTKLLQANGELLEETKALIVDRQSFDAYLAEGYTLILFGSGADKFEELFQDEERIQVVPAFDSVAGFQDAEAYAKYQQGQFEDVAYFEPYYLKEFMLSTPKKLPFL